MAQSRSDSSEDDVKRDYILDPVCRQQQQDFLTDWVWNMNQTKKESFQDLWSEQVGWVQLRGIIFSKTLCYTDSEKESASLNTSISHKVTLL